MQINWTKSFKQRLLFGASQAFVKQLDKGETYQLLQPVYGLGIVAEIYDETLEWYHHYQLVKKGDLSSDIIEHLQLVFIELPKFPIHSPEGKKLAYCGSASCGKLMKKLGLFRQNCLKCLRYRKPCSYRKKQPILQEN